MKAAVSLDLDNKWSYMKTHGDPTWSSYPSYLDTIVPRALGLLDAVDMLATFFIVGQDAEIESNHEVLASISRAGHEIGNHSFFHEPWMQERSKEDVSSELARAEAAIAMATGRRPYGFRGPGFARSPAMLHALVERGYRYDASSLPTFIGPLARAYYFRGATLSDDEARERSALFGEFRDGLRPNRPNRIAVNGSSIAEIPVTTVPGIRTPFHLSYILYLARVSRRLALFYFGAALRACEVTGTLPSLLLHPLDFTNAHESPELAFFPGMDVPLADKLDVVIRCLHMLKRYFDVGPVEQLAALAR